MTNHYPVLAGYKSTGADQIAARLVDRDPERLMRTLTAISIATILSVPMVADEIAALIEESPLYVRPRITRLIQLGVVTKGPLRMASICGRAAHVIEPSDDLLSLLARRGIDLSSDVELWGAVGGFILDRLEDERRAERVAAQSVAGSSFEPIPRRGP